MRNGNIQFLKAYLQLLVGSVDIMDGEIRMSGSEKALLAAAKAGLPDLAGGMPTLVKEWRAVGDETRHQWIVALKRSSNAFPSPQVIR